MSFIKTPDVSLFLHTDFLGAIHMTTSDALVSSERNIPAFWTNSIRDAADNFTGVWIGAGRCLCIILSPPRPLSTVAAVRLWSCVAAPILIIAAVIGIVVFQPVASFLRSGLRLADRLAGGVLGLVVPRSARWWGDTNTRATDAEG